MDFLFCVLTCEGKPPSEGSLFLILQPMELIWTTTTTLKYKLNKGNAKMVPQIYFSSALVKSMCGETLWLRIQSRQIWFISHSVSPQTVVLSVLSHTLWIWCCRCESCGVTQKKSDMSSQSVRTETHLQKSDSNHISHLLQTSNGSDLQKS